MKKKYIDMSYMGIGACILGYADDDVNKAVQTAVNKGNMSTLNTPLELELAELLCKLHPWADMVRYARTGGEALAIAVRIARVKSKREKVLFCGYHGWHDWYLAANLNSNQALDGQLETIRNKEPEKDFLVTVSKKAKEKGIVLITDEVSSGWRLNAGGAHLLYNLEPDIAVFAKAISNGYPMAAIIGNKEVMDITQTTFISSTYWTESIGPAAAISTIKKIISEDVPSHLAKQGKKVQVGWSEIAKKCNLTIKVDGILPLGHFSFEHQNPLILKTLFTQYMLEMGFLATNAYYASFAHKDSHIDQYLQATEKAFFKIRVAIDSGNAETFLRGPVCHSGFKRLT